jgi:hypothetical protein
LEIDRTRFVFLTSLLAASAACAVRRTAGREREPINIGSASILDAGTQQVLDADADDGASIAMPCFGDDDHELDCAHSHCSPECKTKVKPLFKRGIALQIVGCMEKYPSCESLASCLVERGTHDADAGYAICDDPTATAFCVPLVESCRLNGGNEITMPTCIALAKILSATGRDQLRACITQRMSGFCRFDSSTCLDELSR